MRIAWRLINAAQAIVVAAWGAVCISVALALRLLTGGTRLPLAMARRVWAPPHFPLGRVRLEVIGRERVDFARPHLFASNHQSIFDIPALFVAIPVDLRFVARRSLRKVPFLGWYMAAMGMVFVERARSSQAVRAVDDASRVLAGGASLLTFPEGTRTSDGRLGGFQGAALVPALDAVAPVVPVAIDGAFQVLPRGGFRPRPGTIRVTFGEPIDTEGLGTEDRRDLARQVRSRVQTLLGRGEEAEPDEPPSHSR